MIVKRGDIFYADLSPVIGSEQGGLRPVLIVQNNVGNRYSPTVIAAAITSKTGKTKLPTHIDVAGDSEQTLGLARDSVILLEQVRTIDKRRLRERIGHLDFYTMQKVNSAISVSFGLGEEQAPAAVASVGVEGTSVSGAGATVTVTAVESAHASGTVGKAHATVTAAENAPASGTVSKTHATVTAADKESTASIAIG